MKTFGKAALALAAVSLLGLTYGCGQKKAGEKAEGTEQVAEEAPVETCLTAIDRYLTEEIASNYLEGEVSIPFNDYISVDESNPEDIEVLGDFWVFNYDVAGDTLKTVSGGSHPGKMHVRKDQDGHFEVISFDAVADGSDNIPSARRIFGDKFEEFSAANSDSDKREAIRAKTIGEYVRSHNIPVKLYADYGWPAKEIPAE